MIKHESREDFIDICNPIITLVEKRNGQKGNWQVCEILRKHGKNNIIIKPNG